MITTVPEFDDETAWERTVLDFAVPLMPLTTSSAGVDLRTGTLMLAVGGSISGSRTDEFRNRLLPLLFGAGWKVLDLAVELALANDSKTPGNGHRWIIAEKQRTIVTSG